MIKRKTIGLVSLLIVAGFITGGIILVARRDRPTGDTISSLGVRFAPFCSTSLTTDNQCPGEKILLVAVDYPDGLDHEWDCDIGLKKNYPDFEDLREPDHMVTIEGTGPKTAGTLPESPFANIAELASVTGNGVTDWFVDNGKFFALRGLNEDELPAGSTILVRASCYLPVTGKVMAEGQGVVEFPITQTAL